MAESDPTGDPHAEIQNQFAAYADGELEADDERRVEDHIGACAECEQAFEEFQRQDVGLSGLHKVSVPDDFRAEVQDTIRRRSGGRFFGRRAFGDRVPFELLALLAFIVALSAFALVYLGSAQGTR